MEAKLPPFISIDDTLNLLDEEYDGQDIILSYEGCPLLTIRGTNDMSCLEDEEVKQADIDTVVFAERVAHCYNGFDELEAENAKLKAFKKYVHDRLDAAGVPVDPESPHKEHGCRIGGRLDWVEAENKRLRDALEYLLEFTPDLPANISDFEAGLSSAIRKAKSALNTKS